ncbi:nucleotidyltransferase domain-containing protein [Cellulosilyticum sp. I15G10I2]|uniref:nucleotidyltransferase domain-containing protein n=1 Tax=Cellulosilyticum sp. I15G10I2 TaxID=1892843 RepID=UPI00085BD332|nr:nucleotidyltransferase domain-containing protein [Cellulosilyticum sp. I15G10I2]
MVEVGKRYTFNKLFDTDYKIEHIYPSKQKDMMQLLSQLPCEVEKVYVFGSSLTLHCGEESDIDLLVIADKSEVLYKAFSTLFKTLDNEVDVIIKTQKEYDENVKVKNSICDVVSREGLLIYERALCTSTD